MDTTYTIGVNLQLDRVVDSVKSDSMQQRSNSSIGVFPDMSASLMGMNRAAYQLAEVARGIRCSSGITDSSKFFLLRTPGFS
jgi:hypothetical protein